MCCFTVVIAQRIGGFISNVACLRPQNRPSGIFIFWSLYFLHYCVCVLVLERIICQDLYNFTLYELEQTSPWQPMWNHAPLFLYMQWQAMVIPVSLTSLVYMGSVVCILEACCNSNRYGWVSRLKELPEGFARCAGNVMLWRYYVVVRDFCFLIRTITFKPYKLRYLNCVKMKNREYTSSYSARPSIYNSCFCCWNIIFFLLFLLTRHP